LHLTITEKYSSEFRSRGSKFLGYLSPAENTTEVEELLIRLRSEHPTATHHCIAARVEPFSPEEISSDDGEPAGTAGRPILNCLKSAKLINAALIVVRYYGGTKLGKSGLIEAYSTAASEAVEAAVLRTLLLCKTFFVSYHYPQQSLIDKLVHDLDLREIHAEYTDTVSKRFAVAAERYPEAITRFEASAHLFAALREEGESHLIL